MEEPHKTHKEPMWGWLGALTSSLPSKPRSSVRRSGVTRRRPAT